MRPDEIPLTPREQINLAFLRKWIKNAWEARSAVCVKDFYHPECVMTGMVPAVLEGVDQVQAAYQALQARVDHFRADVSWILVRGQHFSLVMELQGVHRDSGLDIVIEVSVHGRLKDDLIYQCHNVVDYSSMYAKLGMLDVDKFRTDFG